MNRPFSKPFVGVNLRVDPISAASWFRVITEDRPYQSVAVMNNLPYRFSPSTMMRA